MKYQVRQKTGLYGALVASIFSGRGHLLFRSLLSIVLFARLPSKFPMRRHGASHNGGCSHADVYLRSAYRCGSVDGV